MAPAARHRTRTATRPEAQGPALGVLFLAGCPLFLWVFNGSLAGILAAASLLAMFAAALHMIRIGQRIHAAYDAAEVAMHPRFPCKIFGSVLIGLLVMILAASQFASLFVPLSLGTLAALLSVAAFGPDPRHDKGTDNPEVVLRQRAMELIDAAERTLDGIVQDVDALRDAELTRRTDAVRIAVMRLLRALSNDPAELRCLRKPLLKFLQLLRSESDHLSTEWEGEGQSCARKRYLSKVSALAKAFEARARKQRVRAAQDAFDLETDLLLDRMSHETAA